MRKGRLQTERRSFTQGQRSRSVGGESQMEDAEEEEIRAKQAGSGMRQRPTYQNGLQQLEQGKKQYEQGKAAYDAQYAEAQEQIQTGEQGLARIQSRT
ncbi:MAG: hypothetical protein ACLU80_16300 [Dorea sp.]